MKKVYDRRVEISINGGEFYDTSPCRHIVLSDEEIPTEDIKLTNLEDIEYAIRNGIILNAYMEETLFSHKKIFCFPPNNYWSCRVVKYKECKLKSVVVKIKYVPEFNLRIGRLKDLLTADEFIEYCKDRMFPLEYVLKDS